MTLQEANVIESVLGYVFKERIGAGGYGEVWRVEAPGGIFKALKIIYGFHDENRAQRELKSLDRIKEVRHPFLLSLERIEVVDGRLVVITELAEKSLKDRFVECRAQGLPGIPRDELLRYLSDAADVLDFLSKSHSLQHLDIKPENLLLVGGHVKVGDFGLVKDVRDVTQSMMAGLTPTYAPPELFDGQPSKSSDQYSLAIVYYEMLTGKRPFLGTTAAQLAAQHIQGRPQLDALPRGDQPVILRALSKSPALRYPDCRSLMDDLAGRLTRNVRRRPESAKSKCPPVSDKAMDTPCATMVISNSTAVAKPFPHSVRKLSPILELEQAAELHPTLFVGIGQTATTILRQLRRRLRERVGGDDELPAIRVLCVDTDHRDLSAAMTGRGTDLLTSSEVLPVPLRKPEEYRRDATMHLNWLSRRWIYNVPRSLQTEGIRPLGRLAFADHHERIFEELHRAIEQVTRPEALARTAEAVELPPAESPRVYLVASIAGGVGSGMVLDMAYSIRTVLLERGFPDDQVVGVLVFSTGRSASERDLTVLNTYSCLSELHHYAYVSGYPGDPACDLPSFLDGEPTLSETYVVDIGQDLSQEEFETAAAGLAEYLFLSTVTKCGSYFDTVRDGQELSDRVMLRSLGISQTASVIGDVATMPASIVAHHLVKRWVEATEQNSIDANDQGPIDNILQEVHLKPLDLLQRLAAEVNQRTKESPDQSINRAIEPLRQTAWKACAEGKAEQLLRNMERVVDECLGIAASERSSPLEVSLRSVLDTAADAIVENSVAKLSESVWQEMEQPGHRVVQTRRSVTRLHHILSQFVEKVTDLHQETRAELRCLDQRFTDPGAVPKDPQAFSRDQAALAEAMSSYVALRLQEWMANCARRVLVRVEARITELEAALHDIQQGISKISADFHAHFVEEQKSACYSVADEQRLVSSLIMRQITTDLPELRDELEKLLQQELEARSTTLRDMLQRDSRHGVAHLKSLVNQAARVVVRERLRKIDLDQLFKDARIGEAEISGWLQRELEAAMPRILPRSGGASRLLVAVPEHSSSKEIVKCLEGQFNESPTIVQATRGDVVVCYEVEQVPLVAVASSLIQSRPDCADLVAHLHTRTDVNWTPLVCPE